MGYIYQADAYCDGSPEPFRAAAKLQFAELSAMARAILQNQGTL